MANKIIKVEGLAQFKEALKNYQASNPTGRLFTQFCGSVEKSTGKSWCPDCVNGKESIYRV